MNGSTAACILSNPPLRASPGQLQLGIVDTPADTRTDRTAAAVQVTPVSHPPPPVQPVPAPRASPALSTSLLLFTYVVGPDLEGLLLPHQ